ncbi:MAG: lactate utilization protein [Desulfobacteraceae bacterium]|nr:lactate utilization protein [Desulfobacteraceae bacterium]
MEQPQSLVLMKQRAEAVQTVVSEVRNMREAFDYCVELAKKEGLQSIAAPGLGKNASALGTICKKNGLNFLTKNLREHIGRIGTGFTVANWGIAETATLVIDSGSEDLRIATMLGEIHVAALPRSRIVADAAALEEELTRMMKTTPSYLSFISGASRTADIERVLTIGVHGPQQLHMLIMEEELL